MQKLAQLYPSQSFLVADRHYLPEQNLFSFADTNAMLRYCDEFEQPIIHFWTLDRSVILGMMDTKLPHFKSALTILNQANTHYFVRNSGGLAVASDSGILNVSLFLPKFKSAGINAAYDEMVAWVQAAFAEMGTTIEAYEITHSYCPGTYDLSINGQKFGGISQRRTQDSVVIMLYLSVNGNQDHRSNLLKAFYDQGLQRQSTKWSFPNIDPSVMATLETLLGQPFTLEDVKRRLLSVFDHDRLLDSKMDFAKITSEPEYQAYFQKALANLVQRNQRDLPKI